MINVFLLRKLAVGFLVGFAGAFGKSLLDGHATGKAAVVAAASGALAAGFRAVLAFGPVNVVGSDAQHSLIKLGK